MPGRRKSHACHRQENHSLPTDQAAFIDAKVNSGDYASASEVVRAGLRALKERDEAVERWLRGNVAAAYDAMQADPSRALSLDDAFASVRAHHAGRVQAQP
jgi:antitoxin ParD1/3/4